MEIGTVQSGRYRPADARRLPRLRHERDRGARPAGCARWPEAGSPAHPVRHARYGHPRQHGLTRNPPVSSARCWASTTRTATRPCTMPWRAWRRISPCATCWWMGRATSARSTATPRRPCATPKPAWHAMAEEMLADIDKEHGRFQPTTSTARCRSRWCCPPACPTCCSTARPASPWAWPPTSRRTTCASWCRRIIYLIDNYDDDRRDHRRRADAVRPRAGFPHRRHHRRHGGHPPGLQHRARAASSCAAWRTSKR